MHTNAAFSILDYKGKGATIGDDIPWRLALIIHDWILDVRKVKKQARTYCNIQIIIISTTWPDSLYTFHTIECNFYFLLSFFPSSSLDRKSFVGQLNAELSVENWSCYTYINAPPQGASTNCTKSICIKSKDSIGKVTWYYISTISFNFMTISGNHSLL